jgi:hypothetical protein
VGDPEGHPTVARLPHFHKVLPGELFDQTEHFEFKKGGDEL